MQRWGGYLFFFGVGSMLLNLINMEFVVLAWIDFWGPTVGWAIRIGMAVAGALLWTMGRASASSPIAQPSSPPADQT